MIDVEALGIEEDSKHLMLAVYPNPSSGALNISNLNCTDRDVLIEITDISGKVVARRKCLCKNGIAQLTLDLNHGAYFIRAIGGDQIERKGKVIISK